MKKGNKMKKSELRNIIQEELNNFKKKKLLMKEDLVTNFLDYLNNIAQKGRLKQVRQDVAKKNPKMAKKLEDFEKQRDKVNKIVRDIVKDEDELSALVDKLGW